jgi:uncharacterized protein (DUF39 family)
LTFHKYGVSLGVGIGVPIPILDEEVMKGVCIRDDQIFAPVLDYSVQSRNKKAIRQASYAELRSGHIDINGKSVRTSSISSYQKAKLIAEMLKKEIIKGEFCLTEKVASLPEERAQLPLDLHTKEEVE